MKKILILSIAAMPLLVNAQAKKTVKSKPKTETKQTQTGVNFIHKVNNWDAVVAQAKKENKYIFVDCFTTWCGPCKYVSSKIFPMKNVGEFYNKSFVNVKLQIDETAKDNADILASRKVAKEFETKYKISVYPTFLVFDNSGKLVHKFCGAGDDKFMIENAGNGLDKEKQYYSLVSMFENGNRDGKFVAKLCKAAADANDNAEEYLKTYVASQKNIFTAESADLLLMNITNANGIAFKTIYPNKEKWYSITEKSLVDDAIKNAVEDEVYEYIQKSKSEKINWTEIAKTLETKYPEFGNEAAVKGKIVMSMNSQDWKEFETGLRESIEKYPNMFSGAEEFNAIAWSVFENIDDKSLVERALFWSKQSMEKTENPAFMDTYANLTYKLGNKEEAIAIEEKAMNKLTDATEKKNYQATIEKMRKGEKTWK